DPALVALTRSCPFYEGLAPGLAVRTAFYRGSSLFGWEGLYTDLPEVADCGRTQRAYRSWSNDSSLATRRSSRRWTEQA
ncbi:MAG TPA: hypothetical protein VEY13_05725, partial [Rubrobacteraceae bacterium]|nr:hypothetical protein [Rubrobacteraceae bacterium]